LIYFFCLAAYRNIHTCDTFRAADYFTESIRSLPYRARIATNINIIPSTDPDSTLEDDTIDRNVQTLARFPVGADVCQFRAVSCSSWESFSSGTCGVLCPDEDKEIPGPGFNADPAFDLPVPVGRTSARCVRMGMNSVYDYNYLKQVENLNFNFNDGMRYYTRTGSAGPFCSEYNIPLHRGYIS
jgi:hypothetical protein